MSCPGGERPSRGERTCKVKRAHKCHICLSPAEGNKGPGCSELLSNKRKQFRSAKPLTRWGTPRRAAARQARAKAVYKEAVKEGLTVDVTAVDFKLTGADLLKNEPFLRLGKVVRGVSALLVRCTRAWLGKC